ncbi:hypothetical protein BKA56DRAFT_217771 [Ilyonectria sp. MPI-CAGE-AT-0026]|nr:hypothetical protein BKA56DRAFT_217771 [Ilyonectria sp. MPI-CAGE-AT-0026]
MLTKVLPWMVLVKALGRWTGVVAVQRPRNGSISRRQPPDCFFSVGWGLVGLFSGSGKRVCCRFVRGCWAEAAWASKFRGIRLDGARG